MQSPVFVVRKTKASKPLTHHFAAFLPERNAKGEDVIAPIISQAFIVAAGFDLCHRPCAGVLQSLQRRRVFHFNHQARVRIVRFHQNVTEALREVLPSPSRTTNGCILRIGCICMGFRLRSVCYTQYIVVYAYIYIQYIGFPPPNPFPCNQHSDRKTVTDPKSNRFFNR